MAGQTAGILDKFSKNRGILGQEIMYIKNGSLLWALRIKENKLWGSYSKSGGQSWQEWQVLVDDYNGYFSFTVNEDSLHLTCKNSQGFLVYLCWNEEEIIINLLDEKWITGERVTFQTILVSTEGIVHVVYFTENPLEEIWRIKYCYKKDGAWQEPEIIDSGLGQGQTQGAAALDPEGTVHLIYQTVARDKFQFVHRERNYSSHQWGEKIKITDSSRNNLYPCLVVDGKGAIHLTWTRSDGMNYRVLYRRKTRGGWMVGGWQQKKYLSAEGVNAYNPAIGVLEDKVIVIWQQTEGIYQSISMDGGKTFKEPFLEEKYQRLLYNNLVSIDYYRKQGLCTPAAFDTGSTAIALLATVFQEQEPMEEQLNLPEVKQRQELMLPDMGYMALDYGQKGLAEHLQKIDGNFQRLLFETEDVRLTNMQMKETITEKANQLEKLAAEIELKEQESKNLTEKIQSLDSIIQVLKENTVKHNNELAALNDEKSRLKKSMMETEAVQEKLSHRLQEEENKNRYLTEKLTEQKKELGEKEKQLAEQKKELGEKEKKLAEQDERLREKEELISQLEKHKNDSLWKRIFKEK